MCSNYLDPLRLNLQSVTFSNISMDIGNMFLGPWMWYTPYKTIYQCLQKDNVQFEQSAVKATKVLLGRGPVVMFFDTIDEASSEQVLEIEVFLRDLIDDENLFVVLVGKTMAELKNERSVARNLKWHLLGALDRDSCEGYLDKLEQRQDTPEKQIDATIRNIIFTWTRGYPLAMNVMIEAISAGHDPRTEARLLHYHVKVRHCVSCPQENWIKS